MIRGKKKKKKRNIVEPSFIPFPARCWQNGRPPVSIFTIRRGRARWLNSGRPNPVPGSPRKTTIRTLYTHIVYLDPVFRGQPTFKDALRLCLRGRLGVSLGHAVWARETVRARFTVDKTCAQFTSLFSLHETTITDWITFLWTKKTKCRDDFFFFFWSITAHHHHHPSNAAKETE